MPTPNPYDALPYERYPIPAMHVDRLATVARLHGLQPAPVEACRVLELGCGSGAHLIPMAASLPGSHFVGVDLSPVQIGQARVIAERLELQNLTLLVADILDLPKDLGPFDVIIAHGVYSWVSEPVRDALMRVIRDGLAPGGVACVSFSVLPGAYGRLALRDMLQWQDDPSRSPVDRAGDASFFAATLSHTLADDGPLTPLLRRLIGGMGGMSDAYVVHDFLAEENTPVTLSAFANHAGTHGLQYVADANLHTGFPISIDAARRQEISRMAQDALQTEQLMDFATQRSFRTALLCHADPPVDHRLSGHALAGLCVTTQAQARGEEEGQWWFRAPGRPAFSVGSAALARVLTVLVDAAPLPVPFHDLEVDGPPDLAAELLALYLCDQIELSTHDRGIGGTDGHAFSFARDQVVDGQGVVTNLWHRTVELDRDQFVLLSLLDGTRSPAQVLEAIEPTRGAHDRAWLDTQLERLRKCGLLASP